MAEGHGSSETETKTKTDCSEIETTAESLDDSMIFHAITDISGFALFMHQQIPSMLPDITLEFNTRCQELRELEDGLAQNLGKASLRRQHVSRMREARQGIRRFEKLMRAVSDFHAALKLAIGELHDIGEAVLALGASSLRPQHVYELSFLRGGKSLPAIGAPEFTKTRAAEALSRKAIRALISMGAGSGPYPGTSKLFLLVKAPSSFHQPLHFLPKRDFKYSKKVIFQSFQIVPFRMRFKCRTRACEEMVANDPEPHAGSSVGLTDSTRNELIWFQCRHTIKGIPFNMQTQECD